MSAEFTVEQTERLLDYVGYTSETLKKAAAVQAKLDEAEQEIAKTASVLLEAGWVKKAQATQLQRVLSDPAATLRMLRDMVERQSQQKTAQSIGKPADKPKPPTEPAHRQTGRSRVSEKANAAFSRALDRIPQ